MKRPKGVAFIAVFFMVSATALLAFVLLPGPLKNATIFAKSLLVLMSLTEFVLAMGLWKMKNWARISAALLVIFGFLSGVVSLLHSSVWLDFNVWRFAEYLLVFCIDLWVLLYLLRPRVKHAFLTWFEGH